MQALRTGRFRRYGNTICTREKNPTSFWMGFAFIVAVAVGLAALALLLALDRLGPHPQP